VKLLELTKENFKKEILGSSGLFLVDFWASWCGPCKIIASFLEELAKEYTGRIKIAKLNIEEAPEIASQYGVMSVPTLLFFKNAKVINQVVGALSKQALKQKIEEILTEA